MKKLILLALVLMIATVGQVFAGGAAAPVGATEITQILNNSQLVLSYAEQAQQTVAQLGQYQTMLTNLKSMTPSHLLDTAAGQLWQDRNMYQVFSNLRNIVVDGQRIAYTLSNIDSQFSRVHPGYSGYANENKLDFFRSYQGWSDNTLDSVKNSLSLMTAHSENFSSEESMMRELMNKSSSAEGQLQALQAGNTVGVQMIGQMQKLRQLQMAQMQAQNSYIAGQQSNNDLKMQGAEKVFGALTSTKIK
jgi:P-type conjugative transfer protein TrbJ